MKQECVAGKPLASIEGLPAQPPISRLGQVIAQSLKWCSGGSRFHCSHAAVPVELQRDRACAAVAEGCVYVIGASSSLSGCL